MSLFKRHCRPGWHVWIFLFLWISYTTSSIDAYAPVDVKLDFKAEEIHTIDCLNMLAYTLLLILTILTIWFFKVRRVRLLHESALAILYGLLVGAIIRYVGDANTEYTYLRVLPAPVSGPWNSSGSSSDATMNVISLSQPNKESFDPQFKVLNVSNGSGIILRETETETPKLNNSANVKNSTFPTLSKNIQSVSSTNLTNSNSFSSKINTTQLSKNYAFVIRNHSSQIDQVSNNSGTLTSPLFTHQHPTSFYDNSSLELRLPAPPDSVWVPLIISDRLLNRTSSKTYVYTFKGELVRRAQSAGDSYISQKATFDPELFFNLILPPIILNAGYSLQRGSFFRNLPAITSFAFLGTAISAFSVALLLHAQLWLLSAFCSPFTKGASWTTSSWSSLSFIDCLYFGALISSTDPVAVLSIFSDLRVDARLQALVLGESVLNDAVAISLVRAVERLQAHFALMQDECDGCWASGTLVALLRFVQVLLLSLVLGAMIAFLCALLTKHTRLREHPLLEVSLFVLCSYSAFLLCELLQLSGIVAILFCGICQAHFTYNNLSPVARSSTKRFTQLLAFLAENFIFTYLGVSIFTYPGHRWNLPVILFSLISILIARALSVYPLAGLMNLAQPGRVPFRYQHVLFFAGMRGAMAYALAMRNTFSESRQLILTTTSVLAIITVVCGGACTHHILQMLHVAVDSPRREHELLPFSKVNPSQTIRTPSDLQSPNEPNEQPLHHQSPPDTNSPEQENSWLLRLWYTIDVRYLMPLLTNSSPSLIETLPRTLLPLARFLTTEEQLNAPTPSHRVDDSNGFHNLNFTGFEVSVAPTEISVERSPGTHSDGHYQRYSFDNNNFDESYCSLNVLQQQQLALQSNLGPSLNPPSIGTETTDAQQHSSNSLASILRRANQSKPGSSGKYI